jgi:hypothetical protein
MLQNFYYSILKTETFNNLVSNLCVTLKRKTESKFAGSNPSPFFHGKNRNGAYAWDIPLPTIFASGLCPSSNIYGENTALRKSDLFPSSSGKVVEKPSQLCPLERAKLN